MQSGRGNDQLYGGAGRDNLRGGEDNDLIYGAGGNDRLNGGSGSDSVFAEAGADELFGREGSDHLSGGSGNDTFVYEDARESMPGATNRDVILDFAGVGASVADRINLLAIDANTGVGGNQAFAFKGTGAMTGVGQVRVVASGKDTLVQANIGGTTAPELEILVKDGSAAPGHWVAGDFIL